MLSTKIFLPHRVSKREQEILMKRDAQAAKESVWKPTLWKRSNFGFSSTMIVMLCMCLTELSYWDGFGEYFWYILILFRPIGIILDMVIESNTAEALLATPIGGAFWLFSGIVTLGCEDFLDFLLGYFIDFCLMLIERTYLDPWIGYFIDWLMESIDSAVDYANKKFGSQKESMAEKRARLEAEKELQKKRDAGIDFSTGDTVEPILGAFAGYTGDSFGIVHTVFGIFILVMFREPIQMPDVYGIKRQDMIYYLLFAIISIPFQFVADIMCLHCLELTHGWKIYDYLVYTRYRFLQRETRWKGLEDSLDECIEEGMRTLDQMCFSSQYYLMISIHITGVVIMGVGAQMFIRWEYNMFGDPAWLLVVPLSLFISYCLWRFSNWQVNYWGLYKLKHEDTAWHTTLGGVEDDEFAIPRWDELDKVKGASHEAYLMNQKITSETFRLKFLDYNRPWLVSQLPSILTPRTLRRSRPYLIAQLTKIMGSVNPDVSSDSDSDDDGRPKFGPVALNTSSRSIIRLWLAQTIQTLKNSEDEKHHDKFPSPEQVRDAAEMEAVLRILDPICFRPQHLEFTSSELWLIVKALRNDMDGPFNVVDINAKQPKEFTLTSRENIMLSCLTVTAV